MLTDLIKNVTIVTHSHGCCYWYWTWKNGIYLCANQTNIS